MSTTKSWPSLRSSANTPWWPRTVKPRNSIRSAIVTRIHPRLDYLQRVDRCPDIVYADAPRTVGRGEGGDHSGCGLAAARRAGFAVGVRQKCAEKAFARRADEDRDSRADQFRQCSQQRPVVLAGLG